MKLKNYTLKFIWDWPFRFWTLEFEKCSCSCYRIFVGPLELQVRKDDCKEWDLIDSIKEIKEKYEKDS